MSGGAGGSLGPAFSGEYDGDNPSGMTGWDLGTGESDQNDYAGGIGTGIIDNAYGSGAYTSDDETLSLPNSNSVEDTVVRPARAPATEVAMNEIYNNHGALASPYNDDATVFFNSGATPLVETVAIGNETVSGTSTERITDTSSQLEEITVTADAIHDDKTWDVSQSVAGLPPGALMAFLPYGKPGTAQYYDSVNEDADPATVPIKSSGNTITVYLVPSGAHGLGHDAFSINGSLPISLSSMSGEATGAGFASLGADNDPAQGDVIEVTFGVSQSFAEHMQLAAINLENASIQGTQQYNVLTNNCSEFVANSLFNSGMTQLTASALSPTPVFQYNQILETVLMNPSLYPLVSTGTYKP